MKKKLQIANGFFLIFTIVFNYLSNTGVFNGKTIANVSDEYHNFFTPEGYAFSIWGLIYLLLIGFVIYTGKSVFDGKENKAEGFVEKISWWFVGSCIANCAWIVTWLYGYTGLSVIVLLIALICILVILVKALKRTSGAAQRWFVNYPFQIYAGWLSVALIAAAAAWLKKIDWTMWGLSEVTWTLLLIGIATVINLFMIWKKNAPVFALVAVWALIAIAVANKYVSEEIYVFALSTATALFLSSCLYIYQRKAFS